MEERNCVEHKHTFLGGKYQSEEIFLMGYLEESMREDEWSHY